MERRENEGVISAEKLESAAYTAPSTITIKGILGLLMENIDESNEKRVISLGMGDPTAYSCFRTAHVAQDSVLDSLHSQKFNGYAPTVGLPQTRSIHYVVSESGSVPESSVDPLEFGVLDFEELMSEGRWQSTDTQIPTYQALINSSMIGEKPAVAEYLSRDLPYKLTSDDVFITSGCTQAIDVALAMLARPGANILLPRPGFPIYELCASFRHIEVRHFDLLPENGWEVDLDAVEALADHNTVALVIINPGNPCGNVCSYQHLEKHAIVKGDHELPPILGGGGAAISCRNPPCQTTGQSVESAELFSCSSSHFFQQTPVDTPHSQIAETARKLNIPVIADEVYGHLAFGRNLFVPMGVFGETVPVLTLGSLSKRWIVPGWRLGWFVTSDPCGMFREPKIIERIKKYFDILGGPATFIQAAVPRILEQTEEVYFKRTNYLLKQNSDICCDRIMEIPCITCPHRPEGSMAVMVKLNLSLLEDISDDIDFCFKLAKEESVIFLPGTAVGLKNWLRITFAVDPSALEEALRRTKSFYQRHAKLV
ncbi:putative aminotransferase TAT2 [Morus notabilis]|uniref:Putative aminotransferase TAT2 n=1 Tax=Morus notabilis TaxID=981085 RepID=W9R7G5_9ROSA|nr:putative aminotransferase TAT2 [Morus notabilis]